MESWTIPVASQMIQVDLPVNVEKTQAHPLQSSRNENTYYFIKFYQAQINKQFQ